MQMKTILQYHFSLTISSPIMLVKHTVSSPIMLVKIEKGASSLPVRMQTASDLREGAGNT